MSEGKVKLPAIEKPDYERKCACKFYPQRIKDWTNAKVICNEYDRFTHSKCERCGWNPVVKAERLRKTYGEKRTNSAIEFSKSITENRNPEYNRMWKDYKPKRGEPDV